MVIHAMHEAVKDAKRINEYSERKDLEETQSKRLKGTQSKHKWNLLEIFVLFNHGDLVLSKDFIKVRNCNLYTDSCSADFHYHC